MSREKENIGAMVNTQINENHTYKQLIMRNAITKENMSALSPKKSSYHSVVVYSLYSYVRMKVIALHV